MTTTKPASELEVVAWASKGGKWLRQNKTAVSNVPLVRQSDAEARIAALTAERDDWHQVADARSAEIIRVADERDAAVAEVARLRRLLQDAIAAVESLNGRCTLKSAKRWLDAANATLHPTQAATSEASRDR